MHTIGGIPAEYIEGEQICYANSIRGGVRKLAYSLQQIKKEQRASLKWRLEKNGWGENQDYGYVKISSNCFS